MNYTIIEPKIWKFPKNIGYENVPGYLIILSQIKLHNKVIIDLSDTEMLHSAFIGFLIHAKQMIEKNNGELKIISSKKCEKIFHLLKINDFFTTNITKSL